MNQITQISRRRFCLGAGSLPLLAGCGAQQGVSRGLQTQQSARTVAVLVPLSGPRAPLGQKMAKAIWLSEDLGASGSRAGVLDAGNSAETASAAATQAVQAGADVIVGPLFRNQTAAVVKAAGGVPVISLSNDDALADQGAWVFGVTPAQSVEAVLRYGKSAGARRITVLETQNELGARARLALNERAGRARVSVLPAIPEGTAPAQMQEALRQAGGGTLPDILYVPSSGAPALEQAVAAVGTGVTTIGSMQWSGLPAPQFARLEKACFTGPDPQRFDRLSASFQAQLDEDVGVIGALAVDAVTFAKSVAAPGNLSRTKQMDGLLGATSLRPDRTCERALSVLRIAGGGVTRVA